MLKINGKYVCPVLKVGNDSDFHATIYVTADVGTSITVDGKTKVVEDEGVMVDFPIYKINTYTITATLDGHTQTQTQSVSSATEYYKTFYMKTELNIYSEVGSVVTLNGVSKTVTEAYVTFDIYETGSYTVSVIKDGVTKQSTISVSNMTQTYEEYVYFTATIIANGAVGVEVTLNGETKTITDDDGVAFTVNAIGSYTLTGVYDGDTETITTNVSELGATYNVRFSFSDVVEVTYIQGDGGYIKTDITPKAGQSYEFTVSQITGIRTADKYNHKSPLFASVMQTAMTGEPGIADSRNGFGFCPIYNDRQCFVRQGGARYWNYSGNTGNWIQQGFKKINVSVSTPGRSPGVSVDGTNISMNMEGGSSTDIESEAKLGIFCSIGLDGEAYLISNGDYQLKYITIREGGTVIADLRAAIRGGIAGLYDRINDKFYEAVGNVSYVL